MNKIQKMSVHAQALHFLKEQQSKIEGASNLSPGTFAMMMGVHVRFRTSTDPPFWSPKFISEPSTGACKKESVMVIEYYCLMNDDDEAYADDVIQIYNQELKEPEIKDNYWDKYPYKYAKSVRSKYRYTLVHCNLCSKTLSDSKQPITEFLKPVDSMMKGLDLYGYISPGLFLLMLGIIPQFDLRDDKCKSVALMAMELIYLIKNSYHHDSLDLSDNFVSETQKEYPNATVFQGYDGDYASYMEYVSKVVRFLQRIRLEYRECSEHKEEKPQRDKFHGKLFVCDTPPGSRVNRVDQEVLPADIQELCDIQICDRTDPITLEDLESDAIKLLVGGSSRCYNRSSLKNLFQSGASTEPSSRLPFQQEQISYIQHPPQVIDPRSERVISDVLFNITRLIRFYVFNEFGIHIDDIPALNEGEMFESILKTMPLDYLDEMKEFSEDLLTGIYIDEDLQNRNYDSQSKALIESFINRTPPRSPIFYGYHLQPGDRGYSYIPQFQPVIQPWNPADQVPGYEYSALEQKYRHSLSHRQLIDRLVNFFETEIVNHANQFFAYRLTPEDTADFRKLFEFMSKYGDGYLLSSKTHNIIELALSKNTPDRPRIRNPITYAVVMSSFDGSDPRTHPDFPSRGRRRNLSV